MTSDPDFTAMILLTYTPRAGTDLDEYDAWLRAVDNPFFNGVPGIARYTNWKVTGARSPVPFTHFDFMGLESLATAETVWQRQDMKDFTAEWRRLWGQGPEASDLSVNAHVYLFENEAGAGIARSESVLVTMGDAPVEAAPAEQRWRLVKPLRGEPRFSHLAVDTGPVPAQLGERTVSAVLLAGP